MVKSALSDPKGPLVEEIPSSLLSTANKVLEILDKPPTAISAKKRAAYISIDAVTVSARLPLAVKFFINVRTPPFFVNMVPSNH